MSALESDRPQIASVRPEMTAAPVTRTGLNEDLLTEMGHDRHANICSDTMLGPVFDARIYDQKPDLARMVAFWSSVALMTGRHHGTPIAMHANLPVANGHFEHWLALFRKTAIQTCPPDGAAHVIKRAERIARSLHMAVEDASRTATNAVPSLS